MTNVDVPVAEPEKRHNIMAQPVGRNCFPASLPEAFFAPADMKGEIRNGHGPG